LQFLQGLVHGQYLFILHFHGKFDGFEVRPLHFAAVADSLPPSRALDEDAPHRLGRRAEEVGAVLELRAFAAAEPQPRLVTSARRAKWNGAVDLGTGPSSSPPQRSKPALVAACY